MDDENERAARAGGSEGTSLAASRRAFRIDAIASGFVGALALAVSTYNVYLQREQIRAQVWPHLEWTYTETGGGSQFEWNVENTGVGPAVVKAVRVRVDGKSVKTWGEALDLLGKVDPELKEFATYDDVIHEQLVGRVLGSGVTHHPLRFGGTRPEEQKLLVRAYEKAEVEICYCSTLDECWFRRESRPVRTCPGEAEGFVFQD